MSPTSGSDSLTPATDPIIQFAFVVPNVRAAAQSWIDRLGVGPWFVRGPFTSDTARYRGSGTGASLTMARAFTGSVMIELIQQNNDDPSPYKDAAQLGTAVFHHVAVPSDDVDATAATFEANGVPVEFQDATASGSQVMFFDTRPSLPGMVEVLGMNEAQRAMYAEFRAAAETWDGTEPFRVG